jgi:hypothetical protein
VDRAGILPRPRPQRELPLWFGDFSSPRESWAEEIRHWEEIGGTHVSLRAMDVASEFVGERIVGYQGPQSYIEALETFIRSLS